jgi:hypothetical protein
VKRPIGCWLVLLPFLLVAGACAPAVALLRAPVLDRGSTAAILVAAEVARADAYAAADPSPLRALFSDSAIAVFRPELARLQQRGQRNRRARHHSSARPLNWLVFRCADLPPDQRWQG